MDRKEIILEKQLLEKKMKELDLIKDKLSKEKESLEQTNTFLKNEIEDRNMKIIKCQKNMNKIENKKKEDDNNGIHSNVHISTDEEAINKYFTDIQTKFNLNLNEKLKWDINELLSMQIDLKITYVIIKKIDFKDTYLEKYNLIQPGQGEPNMAEIFSKMSKINLLNVYQLRECGPILIFRLLNDTKLEEIKAACCRYWNITNYLYNMYDDSFNNLESCNKTSLSEFFFNYEPTDKTLKEGEVTFYMIEKLKVQKTILDSQIQSIDSKSESKEEDNNANDSSTNEPKLQKCIQLFKDNTILKGLEFFGIGSTFIKKDVYFWGAGILQSKIIFSQNAGNSTFYLKTMGDYLKYVTNYIDSSMTNPQNLPTIMFGPMRIRLFKTTSFDCNSDYFGVTNTTITPVILPGDKPKKDPITVITNDLKIVCKSYNYEGATVNTSSIYIFNYTNITNEATHTSTGLGNYDTSGVIIDIYPNGTNYSAILNGIQVLIKSETDYLNDYVRAFEFTYNTYDPNIDLFMANYIFVERDILDQPYVSIFDSIGFKSNVYGFGDEQKCEYYDYVRICLLFLVLISLAARVFQKSKEKKSGISGFCHSFLKTFFQAKNLLVIVSISFLVFAIYNFKTATVDSKTYYVNQTFFDFYQFAKTQRTARGLDILSLYLITLYTLKFLQLIDSVYVVMVAFQKAFFEYFLLSFILVFIFISMSIVMSFVFGNYIFEYNNFADSILINLKIFIFSESTVVTPIFLTFFKNFSIIMMILFIFFIKYFLLMLYYPIFIEYYRMEYDKINFCKKDYDDYEDELKSYEEFGIKERIETILCSLKLLFAKKKKKKKEEDIEMEEIV